MKKLRPDIRILRAAGSSCVQFSIQTFGKFRPVLPKVYFPLLKNLRNWGTAVENLVHFVPYLSILKESFYPNGINGLIRLAALTA